MNNKVRLRFAPSPTGGLHLGGMRTILFNYLYAKHFGGDFILRVEDTDQTRFVEGAEEYILECLKWVGITPDESVIHGGEYGPYRQSERKPIYHQYAQELIDKGLAYYAFDTPEELQNMREQYKTAENPTPQYDRTMRMKMKNSLTLSAEETQQLLDNNTPKVIRILVPEDETISFEDMIRGHISNDSNLVDDKVLIKADGLPTYHFAVVVDDYMMKISHVFRGEEWLPSAPVHILLWKYLGWEKEMPLYAHLPLILKPDGHGKLSKRDGQRLGFPVYPLTWKDPNTGELVEGFKEKGFLPEAFVNLLSVLGWNDGTEQEVFSMQELIAKFTIEKVNKAGAKFDYEKAKWFNQQYIHKMDDEALAIALTNYLKEQNIDIDTDKMALIAPLVKDRCTLLSDFVDQTAYFFNKPTSIDLPSIQQKWNPSAKAFFNQWMASLDTTEWSAAVLEAKFNELLATTTLKKGEVMMPLRIMLVGGKFGPHVFDIVYHLGIQEVKERVTDTLAQL